MKRTEIMMGMKISIEIVDSTATAAIFDQVFDYFRYIDGKFSVFKAESEISRINRDELPMKDYSDDMREVLRLCQFMKSRYQGYFDIESRDGKLNPSGLVKGWAINNAAQLIRSAGFQDFYVDAGGDIEASGVNAGRQPWRVGIRNPFQPSEIVKVVSLHNAGMATSGTYIRGQHIYDPFDKDKELDEVVSLTVIGPDVFEADCLATAAFAMGAGGIAYIEKLPGFAAYQIGREGMALMTSNFKDYL